MVAAAKLGSYGTPLPLFRPHTCRPTTFVPFFLFSAPSQIQLPAHSVPTSGRTT